MKISRFIFPVLMSISILTGCGETEPEEKFVLSFYQDEGNKLDRMDIIVGKTTYNDVVKFQSQIQINQRRGYDVSWELFDFNSLTDDYLVEAKYSLHEYTITYKSGAAVIGETTYNINTKYIEDPVFNGSRGYVYIHDDIDFRNKAEDIIVECSRVEAQYKAIFKRNEEDDNPFVQYFSISQNSITAPNGDEGYSGVWTRGNQTYNVGEKIRLANIYEDVVFIGQFSPNQYTITFDANGGTVSQSSQTVTFDANYELPTPTDTSGLECVGWYDEEDNLVEKTGTYKYPCNITLKAKWGYSFETGVVPDAFIGVNRVSFSIGNEGTDGSHSLKISVNNQSGGNYKVKLSETALNKFFLDPNVVAVNFDAKGSEPYNKSSETLYFRSTHKENGSVSAYTYENNSDLCGLTNEWKTFSFKREYLEGYETIFEGYVAPEKNFYILIDNIRVTYKQLDGLSFDNGYIANFGTDNCIYYDAGHATQNPKPKPCLSMNLNPVSTLKSVGFDSSVKSEGCRSIKMILDSGYIGISLLDEYATRLANGEYLQFDMYTTKPVNSNPDHPSMIDGVSTNNNPQTYGQGDYIHPAGQWVTYTLEKSRCPNGRFMQLTGSIAGTYYFDNFIIK